MLQNHAEEDIAENNAKDMHKLSENVFMFRNKTIGSHDNVFEGEVRSSVYGVRPCVIKFATISEQNVREAKILTTLGSHTNVIAIIQSGTYHDVFEEVFFIALDKCHNENLRQYLANRKERRVEYDLSQAIDFAEQIIAGVMYIHDNNVIHLDLKPSNILISLNLRLIKIADFGLSIVVKSSQSKVFHKRQFGTDGYRPIESFGNGTVSQRTDIFSLGTVLLHLLSNGNEVFGCDKHKVIHNVMNDVTNTAGLLVCNPDTTEHLIKCMVSKERCRRPTIWEVFDHPCWSGKEVGCDIEYFAHDETDDDSADDEKADGKNKLVSSADLGSERHFLRKMKEMGFNRKPNIVLIKESSEIVLFDHQNGLETTFHEWHKHPYVFNISTDHEATVVDEYIYLFDNNRDVFRIEYGDANAKWERMKNFRGPRDNYAPGVVASSSAIFLINADGGMTKSLFQYDPSTDAYKKLNDRPTATGWPALFCNDEFLYCIGGHDANEIALSIVERMDLKSLKWARVSDMTRTLQGGTCAEYRENIYVVGSVTVDFPVNFYNQNAPRSHGLLEMQMYDQKIDQWTELKSKKAGYADEVRRAFVIDGTIIAICARQFHKYDLEKDEWTNWTYKVSENTEVVEAVLVSKT